jgi:hypothetical protein
MATLVLQTAGAFVGGMIGGPFGAALGRAAGAVLGSAIDQSFLSSGSGSNRVGPRLTVLAGVTSTEGAAIARVYGRARIGGQMIWATRFEEISQTQRTGGAGGKGSPKTSTNTTYSYFANFAIALCEGPIAEVRRIWADGKEIDQTLFTIRLYRGDEEQLPDALMVAKEGEGNVPAYRGIAYMVFEHMPLADFGNRVPQLTFEVIRPVNGLYTKVRAIDLIPGASEYAYAPQAFIQTPEPGHSISENRHQLLKTSDWLASLDALQALCPNLKSVALVVSWFGDDLRVDHCSVSPRVESTGKIIQGHQWQVAGLTRDQARVISYIDNRPAYGGTPSDDIVITALGDLKARGWKVVFYPFIMMDIPHDNTLSNPYQPDHTQPAYPWRGRITCAPAPGLANSPDGTLLIRDQIRHFVGSTSTQDQQWSFSRLILHYANLCRQSGGVDAFLIGSELVGLTRLREASGVYPFVQALAELSHQCKSILGPATQVSYSADWTEYGAHVLGDGSEVRFPLDLLWSSSSIDFIGIDAYWPLTDWRDSSEHLDAQVSSSVYDSAYLRQSLTRGEAFDWYYANGEDRSSQTRRPITDGAYHKPWVYRSKDLVGWWSHAHVERVNGRELSSSTSWIAGSKPIWIMETGCPAVDKGSNAPNVFPDAKSSENAIPPFSQGTRDDLIQLRTLEAFIDHFDPEHEDFSPAHNPLSTLYNGRMVDPDRIHLWAWDARPFPAFPMQSQVWGDARNWQAGHWLNGRLDQIDLAHLIKLLAKELVPFDQICIDHMIQGYVIDKPMSIRSALEPLMSLFGFDIVASSGKLTAAMRQAHQPLALGPDDIIDQKDGSLFKITRAQDSELPHELSVTFWDGDRDYLSATVSSRRLAGYSKRASVSDLSIVLYREQAQALIETALQDLWIKRESIVLTLRPSLLELEIGDQICLLISGAERIYQIERIVDAFAREIHARAIDPLLVQRRPALIELTPHSSPVLPGPPHVEILDLAIVWGKTPALTYLAAFSEPWPAGLNLWKQDATGSFILSATLTARAIMGTTKTLLNSGPIGRLDHGNQLVVALSFGALSSVSEQAMLAGKNTAALKHSNGSWEIFSFAKAELIGFQTWRLSELIRGLGGEEQLAQNPVQSGARFVLLDEAIIPLMPLTEPLGVPTIYRIGAIGRDYADPVCLEFTASASSKALRPYAPVQLKAQRNPGGLLLTFIRRSRTDADDWENLEIALGEDSEAYEVEILKNGSPARLLTTTNTSVLYAQADELSDFGSAQADLSVRLYQMSRKIGRGFVCAQDLHIQS